MDNPELYTVASNLQKRDAALVLSQYLSSMNWSGTQDRILDFGCGTGDITCHMLAPCLPAFDSLVGVDISKEMISFAKIHYEKQDPRFEFCQADIVNSIQPRQIFPKGFHKIFSFYCLHWIKDHKSVMENICSLLEPEGEALLVFLASNPIFTMYQRMAERTEWMEYMKDYKNYIPAYQWSLNPSEDFEKLCMDCGLDVIECEAPELSFAFENANQVKNAVAAVNPFLKRIPQHLQDRYLLESLMELQKLKTPSADGTTVACYRLMVAHLRRPVAFE